MFRLRTDLRRLGRDEAGASAVEFALLAPVLFLIAAGAIDTTTMIVRNMEVKAAAQAGADYALAHGWDAAKIENAVKTATGSPLQILALPSPALAKGCVSGQAVVAPPGPLCASGGAPGDYVTVAAQAAFTPIMPWPGLGGAKDLTAKATVRIG